MPTSVGIKNAALVQAPCYAIDDDTAIQVTEGPNQVISEGNWRSFPR